MGIVLDRWDRGIPIPFPQILLPSQFHSLVSSSLSLLRLLVEPHLIPALPNVSNTHRLQPYPFYLWLPHPLGLRSVLQPGPPLPTWQPASEV